MTDDGYFGGPLRPAAPPAPAPLPPAADGPFAPPAAAPAYSPPVGPPTGQQWGAPVPPQQWAPPEPAKRSRTGRVVALSVVGGVLAIGVLGAVSKSLVDPYVFDMPQSAAGEPLRSDAQLQSIVETARKHSNGQIPEGMEFGFFGQGPQGTPGFLVVAGERGLLRNGDRDLDDMAEGFAQGSGGTAHLTPWQSQPAGARGGKLKCAGVEGLPATVQLSVCGWTDKGTGGMVMSFGKDLATTAEITRQVRLAGEHKA